MNGAAGAGAGAATTAAARIQALRANGVIIKLSPQEMRALLQRSEAPLVVRARGGFFTAKHRYLTSYKGLAFFTKNGEPLNLPSDTELIVPGKIWIPG